MLIHLQRFTAESTKLDLESDLAGQPIPGQLTYSRRSLIAVKADLPLLDHTTLPLSSHGTNDFRDDCKIFTGAKMWPH